MDAAAIGAVAGLVTATVAGVVTLVRVLRGHEPGPAPETQATLGGATTTAAAIDALAARLVEQDRALEATLARAAHAEAQAGEAKRLCAACEARELASDQAWATARAGYERRLAALERAVARARKG